MEVGEHGAPGVRAQHPVGEEKYPGYGFVTIHFLSLAEKIALSMSLPY